MAAALGWTRVGPVAAVSDTQNADVLRDPDSKQREAIVEMFGPLVAEAISNTPGMAEFFEDVIDTKVAGLDIALKDDFAALAQTGLFEFPKNTIPSVTPTLTDTYKIDAANYAANTNLNGQITSLAPKPIAIRFGNGTGGVFSVSADAAPADRALRASAGSQNPVLTSVDVGGPVGASKGVVKSLNAAGTAQGIGAYIAGRFDTTTIRYLQWNIATGSRVYILQKAHSDTGYAGIVRDIVLTSAVVAQVGDVVTVQLTAAGVLTLIVNGVEAGSYTLTELEKPSYMAGTSIYAGIVDDPTIAGPSLGSWTWQTISYPLEARRLLTVDPLGNLPAAQLASIEAFFAGRTRQGAEFDIRKYGAKDKEARLISSGAMNAGENILSSGYAFTQADVGKRIGVIGAKPVVPYVNNNGVMIAVIQSAFLGKAILSQVADVTVANAEAAFGFPIDDALNAARDAAVAAGGGTVIIPKATWIVNSAHLMTAGVSLAGADRFGSVVIPLKNLDESQPVGAPALGSWLYSWETATQNPNKKDYLYNVDVHDFTIQCRFWSAQTKYTAGIKPINLFKLNNGHIYNMTVVDSPATAIPYDQSINSSVHHNLIIRPGRLCPPSTDPGQYGGSGIGVGTGESGQNSHWIAFNTIIGNHTATVTGWGGNAIFIEANASVTNLTATNIEGLNIIGNTCIAMPFGITEAGGVGSIIGNNQIVRCGVGISLRSTNINASAPGLLALVHHNVIRDCQGPGTFDGTGVLIWTQGSRPNTLSALSTMLDTNVILRCAKYGVHLRSFGLSAADGVTKIGIDGVRLLQNTIAECGLSAVRVSGTSGYRYLIIEGSNSFISNGKAQQAGNQAAVLVDPGVQWTDGALRGNWSYDLAPAPTQVQGYVVTGAALTRVMKDPEPVYW